MTVHAKLDSPHSSVAWTVPEYAVLGEYHSGSTSNIVFHVALNRSASSFDFNDVDRCYLEVWDYAGMGRSQIVGERTLAAFGRSNYTLIPDLIGFTALSDPQLECIRLFLRDLDDERLEAHYVLLPHYQPTFYDYAGGTEKRRQRKSVRMSCVGFVYECYMAASITIVDLGSRAHPDLTLEDFRRLFSVTDEKREEWGLKGPGPWHGVLLPGQVFHSLARSDDEIHSTPYVPKHTDISWPSEGAVQTSHEDSEHISHIDFTQALQDIIADELENERSVSAELLFGDYLEDSDHEESEEEASDDETSSSTPGE